MKKFSNLLKCAIVAILSVAMLCSFVGCNSDKGSDPQQVIENVSISISADKGALSLNESANLTVTVTGSEDTTYVISSAKPDLISISGNTATVIGTNVVDTYVAVTAKANAGTQPTATVNILVKANVVQGQVGYLTSDMLSEIGNSSITVTGVVTDYYYDTVSTSTTAQLVSQNSYDMTVMMEDGKWSGSWNVTGSKNVISNMYIRGEDPNVTDANGVTGHALEEVYIDKNNTVQSKPVKNYNSISAVWEAQHFWNHLGNLNIEKFSYNVDNDMYVYNIDPTDYSESGDLYLMTYLAYSLTPMLEDTLMQFMIVLDENHDISKILAQTEMLYYSEEDAESEEPSAYSYSTVELTLSDIGTTTVDSPAPYEAPMYGDLIETALTKMQNATSYTYKAVDTTTYAPVIDDSEYSVSTTALSNGVGVSAAPAVSTLTTSSIQAATTSNPYASFSSNSATPGSIGYVTQDVILIGRTIEYQAYWDYQYRTEFSGYRQFADHYEEFEYNSTAHAVTDSEGNPVTDTDGNQVYSGAMCGTKWVSGTFADILPTFDFSPSLFKFTGMQVSEATGKYLYTFVLKESAITRDLALEVSMYNYATDAAAGLSTTFTIVVDEDGNLISTTYPYSLVSGTYLGYVNTTYSNVNSTTIDTDALFDGYIERQVWSSWSELQMKEGGWTDPNNKSADNYVYGYDPNHDYCFVEATVADVFAHMYGSEVSNLPSPSALLGIFGDNIYGPWWDWLVTGYDDAGNANKWRECVSMNAASTEVDENRKITNYEELCTLIDKTLVTDLGYTKQLSIMNSASNSTSRYLVYTKGSIEIVMENMGTAYFYIYFYKTGEWPKS